MSQNGSQKQDYPPGADNSHPKDIPGGAAGCSQDDFYREMSAIRAAMKRLSTIEPPVPPSAEHERHSENVEEELVRRFRAMEEKLDRMSGVIGRLTVPAARREINAPEHNLLAEQLAELAARVEKGLERTEMEAAELRRAMAAMFDLLEGQGRRAEPEQLPHDDEAAFAAIAAQIDRMLADEEAPSISQELNRPEDAEPEIGQRISALETQLQYIADRLAAPAAPEGSRPRISLFGDSDESCGESLRTREIGAPYYDSEGLWGPKSPYERQAPAQGTKNEENRETGRSVPLGALLRNSGSFPEDDEPQIGRKTLTADYLAARSAPAPSDAGVSRSGITARRRLLALADLLRQKPGAAVLVLAVAAAAAAIVLFSPSGSGELNEIIAGLPVMDTQGGGAVMAPAAIFGGIAAAASTGLGQSAQADGKRGDNGISGLRAQAESGNPAAMCGLAQAYLAGQGVERDLDSALHWLKRAAEEGFAPAQVRLANLHEKGLGGDQRSALDWYLAAARKGDPEAMNSLGLLHAYGLSGGPPDMAASAAWFEAAAQMGLRDSQVNLAIILSRFPEKAGDLAAAYKWFAIAADAGDAEAGLRRDALARHLTKSELAQAQAAVAAWQPPAARFLSDNDCSPAPAQG